ncbi:MAG: ABC transporter ATP-binding protein [Myxococcales bacterium]|nr:ABC transporter ATP-binding protein [Myxococcales bacterium]
MIVAAGLRKSFVDAEGKPVLAVDGVSLEVRSGEIVGLLGPNGAGKSTTMRMLATLIAPDAGSARVAGHDVAVAPAEVRRSIGYLSASTGLFGRLTPREVLVYIATLQGCKDAEARAEALLDRFDIRRFSTVPCDRLSTGMKQKVSIARAVVHDPGVLIFDEPTSGLDVLVAQDLFSFLEDARARGRCILYSTHIMGEAERLCDRVVVIHGGVVLATGTVAELRARTGRDRLEDVFVQLVRGDRA